MEEPIDSQSVRRDILIAFEYSYAHDDWVYPLNEALAGLTAQEARWSPGPRIKCIWEIVLHLAVWNENIIERSKQRRQGEPPGKPSEGAWPPLPVILDELAWEGAKARLWDSLAALRLFTETTPIPELIELGSVGYSQLDDLQCRFSHIAYHIGQITKLREWRESLEQ